MNMILRRFKCHKLEPTASLRSQRRCLAFYKTTIFDAQPIWKKKHHKEAFSAKRKKSEGKTFIILSGKVLKRDLLA